MDQLLEDYKAYYKARMDRYEGNPLFTNSYQTEKALSDAMNSCKELIEFKDKIGDLNIKNAIAMVKDKAAARFKHYSDLKEEVRALEPKFQLERIDVAKTDMDVVEIASNASHEAMILITVDLMVDHFYSDIIPRLETIEVLRNMEEADKYREELQYSINEELTALKEGVKDLEDNAQSWQQGWRFNPDLVWEFRHRRKIPLPDTVIEKRLNEYKNL